MFVVGSLKSIEYLTYCTPECKRCLSMPTWRIEGALEKGQQKTCLLYDMYLTQKTKSKSKIPDTYLHSHRTAKCQRLVIRAGLRVSSHYPHKRQTNRLNPTFRKLFFRRVGKAGVDPVVHEFLIGHK